MVRAVNRKLLWAYALLLLLAAVGYARYDVYIMDGDGTAFLDIAQDLNQHHAALAVNGYWNPGYPAVLALVERLTHPSLWRELVSVRIANVLIFALALAASLSFTSALAKARELWESEPSAVPAPALHLLGLALLTISLGRELPVSAPRSDTLLFALLLLAAALVLRLFAGVRLWIYPALGVLLGCAYLTKSFAFLPSMALLLGLVVYGLLHLRNGKTPLLGVAVAMLVFAAVAGPYIVAVSRQLGHFSTGESARLNYAFFIDLTPRWHEWYHRDLGHAGGVFVHPETALNAQPPVFSYAAHPIGTYPLWFDPAWWTLGIKPHLWVKGHVFRFARNIALFVRYLLGRPEIFVLLAVLLYFGAGGPQIRSRKTVEGQSGWKLWLHELRARAWWLVPAGWGLFMLAIYFPVDLQDRYLTGPFFLVILPIFAALRLRSLPERHNQPARPAPGFLPTVASALILLFAGTALVQSASYLADRRRHTPPAEQRHPGYDPQIFTAAAGLRALGLQPGDKVACMGDLACYTDHYWARLAGTQILAEVETPDEANPITVWNHTQDKLKITAPLAHLGLRYIVSLFPNSATKPSGWVQLGGSNFFAYPLQGPISPEQAAHIAALQANP